MMSIHEIAKRFSTNAFDRAALEKKILEYVEFIREEFKVERKKLFDENKTLKQEIEKLRGEK